MTQDHLDESILVQRIVQRDQTALSELYDRYARIIYAVAFRSLTSVEESEELVIDVFFQVWHSADRYDASRARVDTWIFMIARSRILDRLRTLQRKARIATAETEKENQFTKPSVDPLEDALSLERRAQVWKALRQIPTEQRQVIELAYYQGLSQSEIAAQTGISLGTVKTRIRLGLGKLRIALGTSWD
jgi:RNA polymerase sigma factor (sigma-70 family)